jgi:hypothetical protein
VDSEADRLGSGALRVGSQCARAGSDASRVTLEASRVGSLGRCTGSEGRETGSEVGFALSGLGGSNARRGSASDPGKGKKRAVALKLLKTPRHLSGMGRGTLHGLSASTKVARVWFQGWSLRWREESVLAIGVSGFSTMPMPGANMTILT